MTILHKLRVESNRAYLESAPPFVAGTADTVRLEVSFDQSWDGFSAEVLAEQMGEDLRWRLPADHSGGRVLPDFLTNSPVPFFLWVEGEKGEKFLRTNSVCIAPEKLCTGDGAEPPAQTVLQPYNGSYRLTENGVYPFENCYLTRDLTVDVPPAGVDTTEDTVTPQAMLSGFTAHDAEKNHITGVIPTYDGDAAEVTSPEGITLPVGEHYCEKDVTVRPILQELEVTENGRITPEQGYAGIGSVNVDVRPRLQEKHTNVSGTVFPDEGYDGLSLVEVQVPSGQVNAVATAYAHILVPDQRTANTNAILPIISATSSAVGTVES